MSAPSLVTVSVDRREVRVPEGTGMIETALAAGIEIPVFCYEPRLGPPVGACRMCLCEVEGVPKLQAACTLTAREGLVLRTAQASAQAAVGQEAMLEFILLNHPLDCPDCDKGGECPLQDLTFRWGPGSTRMTFPKRTFDKPIPISPLIALDRERCILCYRCTRFSESVSEDGQLVAVNRGASSIIATFQDEPYRATFSGNVTELCPVGALLPTSYRFKARPWEIQAMPSVCGLCPVGCSIATTTREGKVVRILSRNHPEVNEGWLCDKGRFAYGHLRANDRITRPLTRVRRHGLERIELAEAVDEAEHGLRGANGSVVVAFSGAETLEQATALARLVRVGLGSSTAILPDDFHRSLDSFRAPLSAIRDAQVCVVVGDDPVIERAPLVDIWLRAARRAGADVVTIHAAGTVQMPPGSAAGVCAALHDLDRPPPELEGVARSLRDASRIALVWSGDDETHGAHAAALAAALDFGEGSGVYYLPRTPNGRGVAQAWYAAGAGRGAEPPDKGDIGALIVSGDEAAYDPRVISLAERARFVLTSAMFPSELTGWSHLVLPGSSYLERDGTTISLEGRPQRLRSAVSPPWEDELVWLSALCARFGVDNVAPWPDLSALTDPAPLPPPATRTRVTAQKVAPLPVGERGLEVLRYRALFSGPAVERVPELEFQRPKPEVELAASDARARGIEAGDQVSVSSNGTSRELRARLNRRLRCGVVRIADELRARLNRRLRSGVVRIADEHARGLSQRVEVSPP